MLQRKIMNGRFRIPFSLAETKAMLLAAYLSEVEFRHRKFVNTAEFNTHLEQIAEFFTGNSSKFGLLFCGLCGNGKTTWLKAISALIDSLQIYNPRESETYKCSYKNAKELAFISRDRSKEWTEIMKKSILAIDDFGTEPKEILNYGNCLTPMTDLITYRYDEQLFTLLTTNLTFAQIKEVYGERIADRLLEMFLPIRFKGDSFRNQKQSDHESAGT